MKTNESGNESGPKQIQHCGYSKYISHCGSLSLSIAVSRIMLDLNFIVENSFVRLCGKIEILNGFRYYHCFHRLQIAYASFIRYAAIQCG